MDVKLNQMSLVENDPNRLAISEVKNHIETSTNRNLQVTVKSLLTKFSNAPYGWKDIDIQAIIVELFKKQDIKAVLNNEVLSPNNREIVNYVTKRDYVERVIIKTREKVPTKYIEAQDIKAVLNNEVLSPNNREIVNYVTKRDYVERVIIKTREKVPTKYIEALKDLNKDLFGFSSLPSDEDGMMSIFKEQCKTELHRVEIMLNNFNTKSRYPGEEVLKEGRRLYKEVIEIKDTLEFFKAVYNLEDDFLDYVDKIDAIKGFFFKKENGSIDTSSKGEQRLIFDNALDKLENYNENKEYIVNDEISEIIENIKSILRKKEPFNDIPTIPLLIEKYNNKVMELLEEESAPVLGFIENSRLEVIETLEGYDFKNEFINKINEEFSSLANRTEGANSFIILSSMSDLAEKLKVKWTKNIIEEDARRKRLQAKEIEQGNPEKTPVSGDIKITPIVKEEPEVFVKTKTVSMRDLVKGQKIIKNDEDIDAVVESLRKKLKEQLEKDTIISLI